ncbi:MAG: hypothetical protein GXP54_02195 [Deltaproteobacteria bacterium]|nr:hypothetical protein [Deltaproteobacteria bacterium]
MRRSVKIAFGTLILLAAVAGYGVYWWYGAAGGNIHRIDPATAKHANEIKALVMKGDLKSRALSRKRLDTLPHDAKVETLLVMADDKEAAVRLFAVARMIRFRDVPRVRAALARLTQTDSDPDVKKAAGAALAGERL